MTKNNKTLEQILQLFEEHSLCITPIEMAQKQKKLFSSDVINNYIKLVGGKPVCINKDEEKGVVGSNPLYVSFYMNMILSKKNKELENKVDVLSNRLSEVEKRLNKG